MKDFINKFKIPTFLGLGIILLGIGVGVFLVLREQIFLSGAAPSLTPQNINVSNIEEASAVISWQTGSSALSFVTFGLSNPAEETVLDDRDTKVPQPHLMHYVTLKNLLPKTTYQYKVISGKISSEVLKFTTAQTINTQSGFGPVIGTAADGTKPLTDGIAFLSISGAIVQSSLIKSSGNFLIPLSKISKTDLSGIYPLTEDTQAKLTIVATNGEAGAVLNLKNTGVALPSLKIGENLDLTNPAPTPSFSPSSDLKVYDLNSDGKINSADYSLAQKNKGKKISSVRANLTTDKVIDDQFLKELSNTITSQTSSQ